MHTRVESTFGTILLLLSYTYKSQNTLSPICTDVNVNKDDSKRAKNIIVVTLT